MRHDKWYMTDNEIKTLFRNAKDKKMQVRVLAELNLQTERAVFNKLRAIGCDMSGMLEYEAYNRKRNDPWNNDDVAKIIDLREKGMSYQGIARIVKRTKRAVQDKYRRTVEEATKC